MKKNILLAIIFILSLSCSGYAAEFSTFEAFYKDTITINWLIAAIFAIISTAVIWFTGGTASPIVISIGTWVGNMMGLTGIAATNAGLALLGGGSIASGGFGIIGGVALLNAALSFGTDVMMDFTVGKITTEYSYSKFVEQSKEMTTLPLPRNDDGPNSYKTVVEFLKTTIKQDEPLSSVHNQKIIRESIALLEQTDDSKFFSNEIEDGEKSKKESLYALLYFLLNEYKTAKKHAENAIIYARKIKRKRTLPAFIFATSSLYEDHFDFNEITQNYFRYAVLAEPDNPIIPLLFSIYLDRMLYRFNDGYLSAASLQDIANIANEESLKEHKAVNFTIILTRYFMRLKFEQQKILSLSSTQNDTIKNDSKTLDTVKNAIHEYSILLNGASDLLEKLEKLRLDDATKEKVNDFYLLLNKYRAHREHLNKLIIDLEKYQKTINAKKKRGFKL